MKRVFLAGMVTLAALGFSGCFNLDPFLYGAVTTDKYVFEFDGGSAALKIDPSQLTLYSVKESGSVQLGAVYVTATQQPPKGYVLFFHGKSNTLAMPTSFDRIKRFANMGYDVVGWDYRGFGTSTNLTPTEEGIGQDSEAVLAFLQARAPSDKIFYYGHSLGTAIATQLAASHPPFLLTLESPFASLAAFKSDTSQLDFPIDFVSADTWNTIGRVSKMKVPLLDIHGTDDDFIRPLFSEEIYDASPDAPDHKTLILVNGAHHTDTPEVLGDEAYETLITGQVSKFEPH